MTAETAHTVDPGFHRKVAEACVRISGQTHSLDTLRRLTGGANMESWWVDYGPHQWILRRLPEGMSDPDLAAEDGRSSLGMDTEADVVRAAFAAGVAAPEVLGSLLDSDGLGGGFIMQRIAGETMPHKILNNPDFATALTKLPRQCAAELAKIHTIPLSEVPDGLPQDTPQAMIDDMARRYALTQTPIPLFDLAHHWLANNLPTAREPVLVHGDFRMGNLIVDQNGLAAVLDWEAAKLGDPARDLAYLCMPSWRFGNYDQAAGGFGTMEELLGHYRDITGQEIPLGDVHFWLVVSVLNWGLTTIMMVNLWRSGQDRSLERAVIGRRTSETEVDLLLMLEDFLDAPITPLRFILPAAKSTAGETTTPELLDALIEWDETQIFPKVEGRDLFQARVVRNAMRIVSRNALYGPEFAAAKSKRLESLGLTTAELCGKLRAGFISDDICTHLRLDLLERLHIDQPKYAGLKTARQKWVR